MASILLTLLRFIICFVKKLSYRANNAQELTKVILNLLVKSSNNKKKVNKFKKIGNNILQKNFRKIRVLI